MSTPHTDPQKGKLLVHVDLDSPGPILRFYSDPDSSYPEKAMDRFYEQTFRRMLDFFDKHRLEAALFAVGEDIEKSGAFRELAKEAVQRGHTIENHTWSHPFGLASKDADTIEREVLKCSEWIEKVTGKAPTGFRSPGYSMDTALLKKLNDYGFAYDSSGFWSSMQAVLKLGRKVLFNKTPLADGFGDVSRHLPKAPYSPGKTDWTRPFTDASDAFNIVELPLPRLPLTGLPYYHNFNLWLPPAVAMAHTRSMKLDSFVYLFHLVEFTDPGDELPVAVFKHPNTKKSYTDKERTSNRIFSALHRNYRSANTAALVESFNATSEKV